MPELAAWDSFYVIVGSAAGDFNDKVTVLTGASSGTGRSD
jgi:hypothetical protein